MLEIREGLSETDNFITSIKTNQSLETVYSLTSQMYLMFKTNNWGQLAGFSAVFTRQNSVCGGREILAGNRRDIQHSHWSSPYIAPLLLVQSLGVLKYFHALKGPITGANENAGYIWNNQQII